MIQLLTLASMASAALLELPISYHHIDGKFHQPTVEVQIGTPGQTVRLVLDTGSSDIWVPSSVKIPTPGYSFDVSKSHTYTERDPRRFFALSYGDSSYAGGYWSKDTVSVGGLSVSDINFGVGYETNTAMGSLGLGPPELSSSLHPFGGEMAGPGEGDPFQYVPFTHMLTHQHGISPTFSTWMAGQDRTGVLTFGGYDRSRFEGQLSYTSILSGNMYKIQSELVQLGNYTYSHPAIYHVDTGSEFMRVPREVYNELVTHFSNPVDERGGLVCDQQLPSGTLKFRFGHKWINVPLSDLISPLQVDGVVQEDEHGRKLCKLEVSAVDGEFTLGGPFLRAAYVVYDWQNQQIGLAQAKKCVGKERQFESAKKRSHVTHVTQFIEKGNKTTSGVVVLPPQANGVGGRGQAAVVVILGALLVWFI